METYMQKVLAAVKDPDWQQFRVALKGMPTQEKLDQLLLYWTFSDRDEAAAIRVDNYLKALCRGGQLYSGESFETFLKASGKLRIKRG